MDDKRYTLMNKNRPVLDFLYNLDTHHVVKILKRRELDFAPPAILDMKGNPTRAALDGWVAQAGNSSVPCPDTAAHCRAACR